MTGLRAKDGFVGKSKSDRREQKTFRSKMLIGVFLISLLIGSVFLWATISQPSDTAESNRYLRAPLPVDIGDGAKYIRVAYGNHTYVAVWYDYDGKYFNATAINATTGVIEQERTISTDVYTYNGPSIAPAITYDPDDGVFVVLWVNSSNYLEGIALDSNLNIVYNEFTVNKTYSVSYKGISIAYGDEKFFIVWSDSNYHLVGRFMNKTQNSTEFRISNYNSEQKSPWITYDSNSNQFMVVWVNHTGYYNVTGRLINAETEEFTGAEILIGDAYTDDSSYTAPTVSAGNGKFFVTYVTYSSPYNVTGKIYDATGTLVTSTPIEIGNTNSHNNRAPMPSVYNGSVFTVVWSDSGQSIKAKSYNPDGSVAVAEQVIYDGTNGGNPVLAYDSDDATYFFAWTEYQGSKTPYKLSGALWTEDEYIPEFSALLPILAIFLVSIVVWRRKH